MQTLLTNTLDHFLPHSFGPMAKPLQVSLSEEQREELVDVRDHHEKPYMREKLKELTSRSPRSLGLDRSRWTLELLRKHLGEKAQDI